MRELSIVALAIAAAWHVPDAEQQFRAALRVDSDWPIPYAMLGCAADARHDRIVSPDRRRPLKPLTLRGNR